jgi:large subunit ribosomal protein L13
VDTLSYRTKFANKETVEKNWYIVDAEGEVLGRLASKIAKVIRGKHKPSFTPHVDCGDHVVVINASKVKITGNKFNTKIYRRYSGYPGGLKEIPYARMIKEHPERVVELAVKRMLPKTRLGRKVFKNLHVYAGSEHKHEAQKPQKLDLNTL